MAAREKRVHLHTAVVLSLRLRICIVISRGFCAHFGMPSVAQGQPACQNSLCSIHIVSRSVCPSLFCCCCAYCRLRFSVAFWHSFKGDGGDPFGSATKAWPWNNDVDPLQSAFKAMHANFELMSKLGVERWCFHDR